MNMDKLKEFKEMKLSERVRAVAHDVKLCEEDPKINFYMNKWVVFNNGACSVCVAGAFMVKSFGGTNIHNIMNAKFSNEVIAFDSLRSGDIWLFLADSGYSRDYILEKDLRGIFESYYTAPIENISPIFYNFMEEVAVCLEKEGI